MSCWRIAGHGNDTVASAMRSRTERPSTVACGRLASPSMSCAASARECAAIVAMPMLEQIVDGGAEADDAFDVRRAGLVAERRLERLEPVVGEHRDHAAADVAELQAPRTGRGARRARRRRSARTSCGSRTPGSRRRARARRCGKCATDCDASTSTGTPAACAVAIHSSIGATTPVTFDACATLTRRVRLPSRSLSCDHFGTASSSRSTSTGRAATRHGR